LDFFPFVNETSFLSLSMLAKGWGGMILFPQKSNWAQDGDKP
jgi:hypothetical protein